MSTEQYFNRDGVTHSGRVHPEVEDLARDIALRDRKTLTRHQARSFLRLPYADLREVELLKGQGWKEPAPPVAFWVVSLSNTEAVRVPLDSQEKVNDLLGENYNALDLRPSSPKGFGGAIPKRSS